METKNDEIMEIRRIILMANTAYFPMIRFFKSKTIHRKNKIGTHKTTVRAILCYECKIWTRTNKAEEMLDVFERRRIFGPTQDEKGWRIRYNAKMYFVYKDVKVTELIKFRRLQWAGHVIRVEEHRIRKKAQQQTVHCKRRMGKPRKRWQDGVTLLGIRALKTKTKDR